MGSVPAASREADLTARARIRDAAIARFAREGFQKTQLRTIAADAGVSVGLIFHHFGSKSGLRTACDEHFLTATAARMRSAGRPAGAGMPELLGDYLADPEGYRLPALYLERVIREDAPAASKIVDAVVQESEAIFRAGAADGSMRPTSDPRALAVLNLMISLAVLTMPPALARALGSDSFGPDVLRRLVGPTLELYRHGLYRDDAVVAAAVDAWDTVRRESAEKNGEDRRR